MTTFAGHYIQEPADVSSAGFTEEDIITVCDDSGGASAGAALTFADLGATVKGEIVAVMNSIITPAESLIEGYARRRGYAIPLSPLDADVKEIAAQLVAISLALRGKRMSLSAANAERDKIRNGFLTDISSGKIELTAALADSSLETSTDNVHSFTSGADRAPEVELSNPEVASVPRASRYSLRNW